MEEFLYKEQFILRKDKIIKCKIISFGQSCMTAALPASEKSTQPSLQLVQVDVKDRSDVQG
jgi:hypothetical protein